MAHSNPFKMHENQNSFFDTGNSNTDGASLRRNPFIACTTMIHFFKHQNTRMKQLSMILLALTVVATAASAQTTGSALEKNATFTGAKATQKRYHAIYQLDKNDTKVIEKTFRNINNALNDPRLAGKVQIELIAFSGGTDAYLKGSNYENALKELIQKGVIVAQCNNTLKERKINRDQLYDFIAIVPSGNGELIIRQAEGWSVIKP